MLHTYTHEHTHKIMIQSKVALGKSPKGLVL